MQLSRVVRVRPSLMLLIGGITVAAAGLVALAQSPLGQINVRDTDAREWVQKVILDGGPSNLTAWDDGQVRQVLTTFKKLPAAAKGPLTTQLYAWAKTVLMTPAFRARYATNREEQKPVEFIHPGTADDELKAFVAEKNAEMDAAWKGMEASGSKELRDAAAQQRKEWPALQARYTPAWREDIERKRKTDKDDFASAMKAWTDRYPVDPNTCIAGVLREFINTTADVDYAAKQHMVIGEGGSGLDFVNEAYTRKPWQWRFAYEWGPEAIGAARTAAQAWVKEMGK